MSRFRVKAAALSSVAALALAGVTLARAEITQKENVRVTVTGKLSPHALPRTGTAPVAVSVAGQISTTDESPPPQLEKLTIEINRHGRIDPAGLPVCKIGLIRTASNGRALGACGAALVGQGKFFGTISGAGTLSAAGRGLKRVEAHSAGAGVVTLRLALSTAGRKALRSAKHGKLAVKVTVTFTPSDGAAAIATKAVAFKAKSGARPRGGKERATGRL